MTVPSLSKVRAEPPNAILTIPSAVSLPSTMASPSCTSWLDDLEAPGLAGFVEPGDDGGDVDVAQRLAVLARPLLQLMRLERPRE